MLGVRRVDGACARRRWGWRPRQLGTYTSKRAANTDASQIASDGDAGGDRRTVGDVVAKWAATRIHVAGNTRQEYEWAAGHIKHGIGANPDRPADHRSTTRAARTEICAQVQQCDGV